MMKASFRLILAALAATAALVGCTKEITPNFENDKVNSEGSRVIAVSFAPQTKTALGDDGLQPVFLNGDKILVANGIDDPDTCVVSVKDKKATISTNLTGPLTAVYPAKAAKMDGQSPKAIGGVLVPSSQSGKFKDANICMAENITTSASFENKTALFQITPPIGATTFTITSLRQIGTDGQRSGTAVAINTEGADDAAKRIITVTVSAGGTAYVSIVPGVKLTDLSFDAGGTYGMKGIPKSKLGTYKDETAVNTKYTINSDNWHPYVTIGNLKWATMNIGATSSTDYGYYFFWGGTEGYKRSGSNWVKASDNTGIPSGGFCIDNNPLYDSTNSKYTKYTGTRGDGKTVLDLADDAAYVNWGGAWRMPTGGTTGTPDFTALTKACKTGYDSGSTSISSKVEVPTSQGIYYYNETDKTEGVYFVDDSGNKLFFPSAGFGGYGNSLHNPGSHGYYWSSTPYSLLADNAYELNFFSNGSFFPQAAVYRYYGSPVRPVSD